MESFYRVVVLFAILSCPILPHAQSIRILKDTGIKKLSVFIGTWRSKNNPPNEDEGSFAIYTCRWSVNGTYLVCDQIVTSKNGKTNNLAIYSYDSLNEYKLNLVGIPGSDPFSIPVTSSGDTLTYSGSYSENGVTMYTRTLNVFENTLKYYYISQFSKDKKNWTISVEGTAVKIGE